MAGAPASFLFHDYESFGARPRIDRPSQFAAVRTDAELNEIDTPVAFHCQPTRDVLPDPDACLITGITPQFAQREGVPEPEFFARVHEAMTVPGSCVLGYNSIRFDDELTRHGLWRNFFPPYDREWRNGSSRWDLIDPLRAAYALRPAGLNWPTRDDGAPSFRLEHLTAANGIEHAGAHDALVDVRATIALARRMRNAQPRLWEFLLTHRDKRSAARLLDLAKPTMVLHTSTRFPAHRGCTTLVMPLAANPSSPQGVIVFDLMTDPSALLDLDVDDLRDRIFVPRIDLPEGVERIPLKMVHLNRCPVLAPANTLAGVDLDRIALDPERCQQHFNQLLAYRGLLSAKLALVFANERDFVGADPEADLYGGLPPESDLAMLPKIRRAAPGELADFDARLRDPRYRELLFRYRARHYPESLDADETARFQSWVRAQLIDGRGDASRSIGARQLRVAELRETVATAHDHELLDALDAWLVDIEREVRLYPEAMAAV
ncbi:MAG TPA: exodeoxyribonuclease I [Pseudomonadota bacterium]|nr:exodeoxyribonuclease I [Xanthomonadales bacterium]HQW81146.1 exodeoxyribonuclease I [Pseudomonadota bacterium]